MDINNDRLYRSFMNGSQVTVLVSSGIQCSGEVMSLFGIAYTRLENAVQK